MTHGWGASVLLAAVIGLTSLAPAQAAAAGTKSSPHSVRQTLPLAPRPAASPARPAAAAPKLDLPGGVGPDVRVTQGTFFGPSLAVDPTNSMNLVGAAATPIPEVGIPQSTDGGASWGGGGTTGPGSPAAITHPDFAYLNLSTHSAWWLSWIGVDASGGRQLDVEGIDITLSQEHHAVLDTPADGPDMPAIATDPRAGNGGIYVGYTANPQASPGRQPLMVAASHDSGTSFGAPVQVWDSGGDFGASPAVAADGTVYMAWDDYCGLTPATAGTGACPRPNGQILFSRSTDGGATWSATPTVVSATTTGFASILPHYGTECSRGCPARPVTPAPQIAIDLSKGPRHGTIYLVYGDGSDNGSTQTLSTHRMHVFLQESKDGGVTWSNRVRLDAGNPEDAWEPTAAVDQNTGNLLVAWYDRRDDRSNRLYRPYFRESLSDSGGVAQLTPELPVADVQSDPTMDCNGTGDRLGIAGAFGQANVIWTDTRDGTGLELFAAGIVELEANTATSTPLNGSSAGSAWHQLPGGGQDIGVGSDCTAWIIGLDGEQGGFGTWFFDRAADQWNQVTAGAVRISNTAGLGAWIVNNAGTIYRRNQNGLWENVPGGGTDIAVGGGATWLIGIDGVPGGHGVYHLTASGWQFANGGGVRIAVGPDGLPWIVNNAGQIWHLTPGGWAQVPGGGRDIGVGADGSVWIIGLNPIAGGWQTYSFNGSGWDAVNGGGVAISVGPDGMPWVVNSAGQIFERV